MTRSVAAMGTIVSIGVDDDRHPAGDRPEIDAALARAIHWFHDIEARCSRFDPESELRQLTTRVGVAVPLSDVLFETVSFALAVAEASGGAFDPTLGASMEAQGFDLEHRSRERRPSGVEVLPGVSYRDVHVDASERRITITRPLVLDLGAVAKGLAIDLAVRELRPFRHFVIDAGGDLYLGGHRPDGAPWRVGIRHPRQDTGIIEVIQVCDQAVCTSGDYERRGANGDHHILDPATGRPAGLAASATVVAPKAMVADALATAAFVLGPSLGLQLVDSQGAHGLIYSPTMERYATPGFLGTRETVLPHPERPADHHSGGARRDGPGAPDRPRRDSGPA